MIKRISFFLICFLVFSTLAQDSTKIIIYGDDAYEPYSYSKNGQELRGIYPQILREIFKKMPEYQVEIKPMPWNRALKALENDQIFAIFPPYHRPSERPYISRYSDPILAEEIVLFGPKIYAQDPKLKKFPENWAGKHFAMFLGTQDIAGPKFQKAIAENLVKISEEKGSDQNLILVGLNKRDGYINDRVSIIYNLNKMTRENQWPKEAQRPVEILSIGKEHGYLAFGKNSKNQYPYTKKFINRFNQALKELKESGEIDRIVKGYLQGK